MKHANDKASQASGNILLAVTGMSPQVVTETVYALAVKGTPVWIPDQIHLITTGTGAKQAQLSLLSESPGWFHRLRKDYGLPEIRFDSSHIHAIRNHAGQILDDIRTPADNDAAADFITEVVRQLTADPTSSVHASIAGGRKTMGFYLGYALSLYGRPQDHLSHVLISEPFEGQPDFFYPTPYETVIQVGRDKKVSVDAREARVELASIPFVRLREGQPRFLLEGRARFSESVAAAQRAVLPPTLSFDMAKSRLLAGGIEVPMSPSELAFYAMLARRAKNGSPPLRWTDDDLPTLFLNEYASLVGRHSGHMEQAEQRLTENERKAWFDERKSKCKHALLAALDTAAAKPYLIQSYGPRSLTRFGLSLPPEAIRFHA